VTLRQFAPWSILKVGAKGEKNKEYYSSKTANFYQSPYSPKSIVTPHIGNLTTSIKNLMVSLLWSCHGFVRFCLAYLVVISLITRKYKCDVNSKFFGFVCCHSHFPFVFPFVFFGVLVYREIRTIGLNFFGSLTLYFLISPPT